MDINKIKQFIKKSLMVTISDIQDKFALSYDETSKLFEQLEKEGAIEKICGIFYEWSYSDMPELFEGVKRKHLYLEALRYCIDKKEINLHNVCKKCEIEMDEAQKILAWMRRNKFISEDNSEILLSRKEFVELFGDVYALYYMFNAKGQPVYDDEEWERGIPLDDEGCAITDEEYDEVHQRCLAWNEKYLRMAKIFEEAEREEKEKLERESAERNNALRDLTRALKRVTFKVSSHTYTPMVEEKTTTDGEIIVNLRDGDVRKLSSRYKIKKSALGKFAEMKIEASLLRQVCHARDCTAKLYELLVRKYPNITKRQMMSKLNNLWTIAEDCGNWKITYAVKHLIEETVKLTVDQFETKRKVTLLRAQHRK